jgi:hypothetical protein
MFQAVSRVQHHYLKKAQGIRKGTDHDVEAQRWLGVLLYWLDTWAAVFCRDSIPELTEKVWSEVKKRDWKKNAVTGAA